MWLQGLQEDGPAERPSIISAEHRNQRERQPLPMQPLKTGDGQRPVERVRRQLGVNEPYDSGRKEHASRDPFPGVISNLRLLARAGQVASGWINPPHAAEKTGTWEKLNLS